MSGEPGTERRDPDAGAAGVIASEAPPDSSGGEGWKRVVTGLFLAPLAAVFYFSPPQVCLALLGLGAAVAYLELCGLLEGMGHPSLRISGVFLVLALVAAFSLADWGTTLVLASATAVFPLAFMVRRLPVASAFATLAGSMLALVLAGVFMGFQMAIRLQGYQAGADRGAGLLVFLYATVFAGDTLALYTGKLLGRHKMSPRISPRKTWEGLAGNFTGNLVGGLAAAPLLPDAFDTWEVPLLALMMGAAGVLGDLTISGLKRSCGLKDMGGLLPGHGGLMDRLDSLLLSAPLLFYYGKYVAGLPGHG